MHTGRIAATDQLGNRCAPERRREPELVAAGQEHAIAFFDVLQVLAALTILARLERQDFRMLDADLAKQLFVVAPGVLEFGRRRDDADARLYAAADFEEAVEDLGIVKFLFGAADRDDVSAVDVRVIIGWTHVVRWVVRRLLYKHAR